MKYDKQIDVIENYLRDREKTLDQFKIGVEFEHFIIDKDSLESISYYHENGVKDTLEDLVELGWTADYEDEYILGVHKGNKVITLEPGSQFELSIVAQNDLRVIEKEYQEFIVDIKKVLDKKNQRLIAVGYHPVTKIEDIKLLPKERYNYMFSYFKDKGKYAHNMMKGTAALQVSIDYKNEEDYRKKVRIANAMAPIFYGLCDNSYYFEGEKFSQHGLRTLIWQNMDNDRSGTIKSALEDDFSYRKYAEYILEVPPIFEMKDGEAIYTGSKKMKDIFNPDDYKLKELEHLMTMVFPDVRTKGFIEIRMMDSIPYPYNFGIIALIKGLFYDEDNVEKLYEKFKDIKFEDIDKAKEDIIKRGIDAEFKGISLKEWCLYLLKTASDGLNGHDCRYLRLIKSLIEDGLNPYKLIEKKADLGMKESLSHCILENFEVI